MAVALVGRLLEKCNGRSAEDRRANAGWSRVALTRSAGSGAPRHDHQVAAQRGLGVRAALENADARPAWATAAVAAASTGTAVAAGRAVAGCPPIAARGQASYTRKARGSAIAAGAAVAAGAGAHSPAGHSGGRIEQIDTKGSAPEAAAEARCAPCAARAAASSSSARLVG